MNYPLIKRLGLEAHEFRGNNFGFVFADELEKLLEGAAEVYSFKDAPYGGNWAGMDNFPNKNPTHEALLVGIQETPKEPLKWEHTYSPSPKYPFGAIPVPQEMQGKNFKVTFEEVL